MSEVNVSAEEFRVVTVDAAESLDRVTAERDVLQQRLTAADERADMLEGLLRRSQDFVAFVHKCVRRNGEYAPLHRQEMDELNRDLSDCVEPGVPVCEQCRGEGRVGGPAPDEGGGKNCPACDGTGVIEPVTDAALKPAEGGGDA